MKFFPLASLACAVSLAPVAHAGLANDIPSCYAANKMPVPAAPPASELFVLVDQTTPLDASLQDSIRENIGRLIKPGSGFVIASFSAFGQGRYMEVLSAGTLESQIDETTRNGISVKLLRNFDACMGGQLDFGRRTAATALNKALSGTTANLRKSDVMGSLRELSSRVRQSAAPAKTVFVASDMLENSGVSSFYANNNVRAIDPKVEMKKAEGAQMLGDFGGAQVYVIGAGLLAEDAKRTKGVYRDPKTMQALATFWRLFFERSNAQLVEFGQPALLNPVR